MINVLELKVFFTDDPEKIKAMEIGIDIPDEDFELQTIGFFNIDCVRQIKSDSYCEIVSGGIEYIVAEPYEVVLAKIQERLTFKWN